MFRFACQFRHNRPPDFVDQPLFLHKKGNVQLQYRRHEVMSSVLHVRREFDIVHRVRYWHVFLIP